MIDRSRIKWTLDEIKRNPYVCAITRVQAVGADPSELERAIDNDYAIIAPTVGVQEGRSNPVVRYYLPPSLPPISPLKIMITR